MRLTLRQALLLGLTLALIVALVPAGLALDRYLATRLERSARAGLVRAPMLLEDRNKNVGAALMMHAQEVAGAEGLAAALASGDRERALALAAQRVQEGEEPVVASAEDPGWIGVAPTQAQLEATRAGEAPVGFVRGSDGRLFAISVAPVVDGAEWRGAAGVVAPVDQAMAGTLAGLTAADVIILGADTAVASTLPDTVRRALESGAASIPADQEVHEIQVGDERYWVAAAELNGVGRVLFVLDAARELALLPELRRGALLAGALALVLALVLGIALATGVARPVRSLASAADRLSAGDFGAPLSPSRIEEVDRMAHAFERMRSALEARLAELSDANRELGERQERLQALQAELIRRDRLAASGRLVTELAHEIRNPVANIRNCLEVVRRRLDDDEEGARFADMAIDEVLRMHELAEQMLDLNRPVDPGAARGDAGAVLDQVASLFRAGSGGGITGGSGAEEGDWRVEVEAAPRPDAAIPPDALKQVLINLVQNAREAMTEPGTVTLRLREADGRVVIEVEDEGPGIPAETIDHIFDPFFTTKGEVSGVGLGLFIAQGLVARFGGRLTAENVTAGADPAAGIEGARFRIELPAADGPDASEETGEDPAAHPSAAGGDNAQRA